MKTFSFLFFAITILTLPHSSQGNKISIEKNKTVDSLLNQLKKEIADTNRIIIYSNLCRFYERISPDTAMYFANLGLKLAIKEKYIKGIAECYFNIGDVYYVQSNYDSSTFFYIKAADFLAKIGDKKGIIKCYSNIGGNYYEHGNYNKSIEYCLKSLKISDELDDKEGMARCNNNIGILYEEQGNNDKALVYYFNSVKIYEDLNNRNKIAACYINIGNVYMNKKDFEKSKDYLYKALDINVFIGDKKGISKCYNNLGLIFNEQKNFSKSLELYLKSLKIDREINDKNGTSTVMVNIAGLNMKLKKYNEAIEYAHQSLLIANETGALVRKKEAYMYLSAAYDSLGSYKNAIEYHKLFKQISDSIINIEKSKQLVKMEAVYQNEKKKKEIELLEKDKKLKSEEIRRQVLQKYSSIGGFILMAVLALVIFNSLRQKKKAHKIISEKNEELHQQNEEIRSQRDEIEMQKQQIELIHEELKDSIHYAERIQQAVLPNLELLLKGNQYSVFGKQSADYCLPITDYFVLFKPKDVVSGDFYWATKINSQLIVCVADCTGHGVPGAFMSMLGISFLNEIVRKKEVTEAAEVLNRLRESIVEALKQKGQSGEQKDGMDIALCAINSVSLEMQFAGANNPLYIVSSQQSTVSSQQSTVSSQQSTVGNQQPTANSQLLELKGDKMPIGIYERMTPFTNHTYQLNKGDIIYLMSDGYEDQFGGSDTAKGGKKFKAKQLKELLAANCQKPMADQRDILDKTISEWKGSLPQVDDICIMGIKV